MTIKNFFLDMDGMMAMFPDKHGEAGTKKYRTEEGFFRNLQAYKGIELLNEAIGTTKHNVYILTTSPNEAADNDKIAWLAKNLPNLKIEQFIPARGYQTKSGVASKFLQKRLDKNDILIDDYSKNLEPWDRVGGRAIKRQNGKNIHSTWQAEKVCRLKGVAKMLQEA